jgi:hypothetical protein
VGWNTVRVRPGAPAHRPPVKGHSGRRRLRPLAFPAPARVLPALSSRHARVYPVAAWLVRGRDGSWRVGAVQLESGGLEWAAMAVPL